MKSFRERRHANLVFNETECVKGLTNFMIFTIPIISIEQVFGVTGNFF